MVAPAVLEAIRSGVPVVALESAVVTHGLPKPAAIEAVRRQWEACQRAGATPAVGAVFEGQLRVGLTLEECASLAARDDSVKVSPWNLAASPERPGHGGGPGPAAPRAPPRPGGPGGRPPR